MEGKEGEKGTMASSSLFDFDELRLCVQRVLALHPNPITNLLISNNSNDVHADDDDDDMSLKNATTVDPQKNPTSLHIATFAEELVTCLTNMLSVGIIPGLCLWHFVQNLEKIPSLASQKTTTNTGSMGPRQESDAVITLTELPPSSYRDATAIVYQIKTQLVKYSAAVKSKAFIRLALNENCLLSALEVLSFMKEAMRTCYVDTALIRSKGEPVWDDFISCVVNVAGPPLDSRVCDAFTSSSGVAKKPICFLTFQLSAVIPWDEGGGSTSITSGSPYGSPQRGGLGGIPTSHLSIPGSFGQGGGSDEGCKIVFNSVKISSQEDMRSHSGIGMTSSTAIDPMDSVSVQSGNSKQYQRSGRHHHHHHRKEGEKGHRHHRRSKDPEDNDEEEAGDQLGKTFSYDVTSSPKEAPSSRRHRHSMKDSFSQKPLGFGDYQEQSSSRQRDSAVSKKPSPSRLEQQNEEMEPEKKPAAAPPSQADTLYAEVLQHSILHAQSYKIPNMEALSESSKELRHVLLEAAAQRKRLDAKLLEYNAMQLPCNQLLTGSEEQNAKGEEGEEQGMIQKNEDKEFGDRGATVSISNKNIALSMEKLLIEYEMRLRQKYQWIVSRSSKAEMEMMTLLDTDASVVAAFDKEHNHHPATSNGHQIED